MKSSINSVAAIKNAKITPAITTIEPKVKSAVNRRHKGVLAAAVSCSVVERFIDRSFGYLWGLSVEALPLPGWWGRTSSRLVKEGRPKEDDGV